MVRDLSKENSIFSEFMRDLRDEQIQQDRMRFRKNLERMGEVMAYELSKTLDYSEQDITTPLGNKRMQVLSEQPVIATIFRAGLPLHQGMLNYFDKADNAFVSAYRKHAKNEDDFTVEVEYLSSPPIDDRIVIITDPMLATGSSMLLVYKALLQRGQPKQVHVVSVIGSDEGVQFVKRHMPANTNIWIGAVDSELTARGYIVPGLGDAGDLAYGEKL